MPAWTHPICIACWKERNPNREPVRIASGLVIQETCCFCGEHTSDGIYVREDPAKVGFCPSNRKEAD